MGGNSGMFPLAPLLPLNLVERIFINTNRHHDLRNLRMVSKFWKDFIDSEMLNRSVVVRNLNNDLMLRGWRWKKKRLQGLSIEDQPYLVGTNCILLNERNNIQIYRENGDYVGFIRNDLNLSHFVEVRKGLLASLKQLHESFQLQIFTRIHLQQQQQQQLQQQQQQQRQQRNDLWVHDVKIPLFIAFKWINKQKVLLVSIDLQPNRLVIFNLVDKTKVFIEVSNRMNSQSFRIATIDNKGRFMAIQWLNDKILQIIDCVKAKEVLNSWDYSMLHGFSILEVSETYTCLICEGTSKGMTAHFFDNETGRVISSFSTQIDLIFEHNALLASDFFIWCNNNNNVISVFDPKEGKLRILPHSGCLKFLSEVMADRFVILDCGGVVKIMDLKEETSAVVDSLKNEKFREVSSGKFLCWEVDNCGFYLHTMLTVVNPY